MAAFGSAASDEGWEHRCSRALRLQPVPCGWESALNLPLRRFGGSSRGFCHWQTSCSVQWAVGYLRSGSCATDPRSTSTCGSGWWFEAPSTPGEGACWGSTSSRGSRRWRRCGKERDPAGDKRRATRYTSCQSSPSSHPSSCRLNATSATEHSGGATSRPKRTWKRRARRIGLESRWGSPA